MTYLIVFLLLVVLSIVYLKLADKFNIIDKPNHRSSHTVPTIRGGGILFLLAILIYFIVFDFKKPYFIFGVSIIAFISFIDDIITLSSRFRLPFQFIAIALCLYQVGYENINPLFIIPLLIIGVGYINIYNFMDGINGITGFYSISILLFLNYINLLEKIIDQELLIYVLMSVMVFGFYNFRKKARMFAGDIGSITMAVLIFYIGTIFLIKLNSPVILLLTSVYCTDAILTIFRRKFILKENLTEAHRHHLYQKFVDEKKLSHLKVSFLYLILQISIGFIVLVTYKLSFIQQLVIVLFFAVFFIMIYFLTLKKIER